jgi:DNA invertase Pin-like site-specific DNA recombinase
MICQQVSLSGDAEWPKVADTVIEAHGCYISEKIYEETRSGTDEKRPVLAVCLDYVRDGETLVVTRLDRLARSTLHLCQIAARLAEKGVELQILEQQIDTNTSAGRLLFTMLEAIAQFEIELRAERQMEGILKAKQRGVRFGREKRLSTVEAVRLRQQRAEGRLIKELMAEYGLSKMSVYRYLAQGQDTRADLAAD